MLTMLYDFLPLFLFFLAFKLYGIYAATAVGIAATGLQVVTTRIFRKRYDKQQLITFVVFVIFGGMTLYFHNPLFIKWKPTVIFWIFAMVFFGSQFVGAKPLIQRMLEHVFENQEHTVPHGLWKKLNFAWAVFFALLGGLNLYVAYTYTLDIWVNFKVYGIFGLLVLFSIVQAIFLSRYLTETKEAK